MSRMPRPVPVIGTLAIAAVTALTGCGAGQVAQTSGQSSTINGVAADVGDLALRDIRILYPSTGSYVTGSTALLAMVVVNRGLDQDNLVDVTGDFFDAAAVPADSAAGLDTEPSVETPIPPEESLQFGTSQSPTIELRDLSETLAAAQVVSITFVFEKAGEVTVDVPVANPTRAVNRGESYDFQTDEQSTG